MYFTNNCVVSVFFISYSAELAWVLGHMGINENEIPDQLARDDSLHSLV
jgi:ribonuclease HI